MEALPQIRDKSKGKESDGAEEDNSKKRIW